MSEEFYLADMLLRIGSILWTAMLVRGLLNNRWLAAAGIWLVVAMGNLLMDVLISLRFSLGQDFEFKFSLYLTIPAALIVLVKYLFRRRPGDAEPNGGDDEPSVSERRCQLWLSLLGLLLMVGSYFMEPPPPPKAQRSAAARSGGQLAPVATATMEPYIPAAR